MEAVGVLMSFLHAIEKVKSTTTEDSAPISPTFNYHVIRILSHKAAEKC